MRREGVAETVYEKVKALPEPLAREVLVFVERIAQGERASWDDLMGAQSPSLAAVWDGPEDSAWDDH